MKYCYNCKLYTNLCYKEVCYPCYLKIYKNK